MESFELRRNCPYSEFLWSAFSRIRTEYGDICSISWYSVKMRETSDQNNSKYGNLLCSVTYFLVDCKNKEDGKITERYFWMTSEIDIRNQEYLLNCNLTKIHIVCCANLPSISISHNIYIHIYIYIYIIYK